MYRLFYMLLIYKYKYINFHEIFSLLNRINIVINSVTNGKKTIDKTRLLLTVPPHSGHRLVIVCRIPIWIEHDETICTDEIQAASTGFRAEHKDEIVAAVIIKILDYFRSFLNRHCTVEPHIIVGTFVAEFLEQIESLRVIGY